MDFLSSSSAFVSQRLQDRTFHPPGNVNSLGGPRFGGAASGPRPSSLASSLRMSVRAGSSSSHLHSPTPARTTNTKHTVPKRGPSHSSAAAASEDDWESLFQPSKPRLAKKLQGSSQRRRGSGGLSSCSQGVLSTPQAAKVSKGKSKPPRVPGRGSRPEALGLCGCGVPEDGLDVGVAQRRGNKLVSERGSEDAFLVEGKWVGLADAVRKWGEVGVNSGIYSQDLLWHCTESIRGMVNRGPKEVLVEAHMRTAFKGSCTAILAALEGECLRVANVGDSGFVLIRHGVVVAKSDVMRHDMASPFQIGLDGGDDPSCAMEYSIAVQRGDVLVLGTDVMFDSLAPAEIAFAVAAGLLEGCSPEALAERLICNAFTKSQNSPTTKSCGGFSSGSRHCLDDITALVVHVG